MRTNLNSIYLLNVFATKNFFTVEKVWHFGLFSGDKGDNIDMQMIKITIKANQIDMDVLLISKVDNIQKPCLSPKCGFFHYFIGLRILPSWTNIVPKIYRDLPALEGIILTSYLWLFLLRIICLPTACHLVNLQARFSKVEN